MKIVTTTSVLPIGYDPFRALLRLKQAGFSHLDLAIDYLEYPDSPLASPDWRDWAKELGSLAGKNGVEYTHAHAPGDVLSWDAFMQNSFPLCEILGIRYLVVHPICRHSDKTPLEEEEFLRANLEATKPLLALAKQHGLILLLENLLWGASMDPRCISKLVELVDSPYFGWCFDTGHANAHQVSLGILEEKDVIAPQSLHIQDNHGVFHKDEHLIPGDGVIDWEAFLKTLHKIDYRGDLVLEAHHQSIEAPDEQRDAILQRLYKKAVEMKACYEAL